MLHVPDHVPERIVSLVPSHTQTLYDLGLRNRVVGRTRFCIHPKPWVDSLAVVGGTKDAKLERILALKPDLVLADKDENPLALVQALQEAGVEVLWSAIDTVTDVAAFLRRLGQRLGTDSGEAWARRLEAFEPARPTATVFCPVWHHPWMTFNATSYCHAMLAAVGLQNAFANRTGTKYFEVGASEVAAANPDWILLPTEPFPFHKKTVDVSDLGPAGQAQRVRVIDGEALTWFGTRTVEGLETLRQTAQNLSADA